MRSAGDAIHEALVATANVPQDDRFQIFHLVDGDHLIAHPSYSAEIARRLESAVDVRPDDVLICLVEVAKETTYAG